MADGSFPRCNAADIQKEEHNGRIVSLVGRIESKNMADGVIQFQCSDGGMVQMDISNCANFPENGEYSTMEAIGQVDGGNMTLFITRELTEDTNMEVYDKMLKVWQNKKYAHYFEPAGGVAGQ